MSYLLIASFIWAFSYGLIKLELTSLDPNFVAMCRMILAFFVFLPLINIKKSKPLVYDLLLVGALQYGVMYLFVLRSYQYLDAYQVVLFTATTPLYIIFFNSLFEHRLRIYHFMVAGIAVIGGGITYNVQSMHQDVLLGFFLVQLSDICFSLGQVYYVRLLKNHCDLRDKNIYGVIFLGAVIVSIISTTWFGGWHSMLEITLRQSFVLTYLGIIPSGLCFFWWNKGAIQTSPLVLSVFNNLKLPLATLVSIVFFHEQVKQGLHLAIGLLLIVFALFLAYVSQRKKITSCLEA